MMDERERLGRVVQGFAPPDDAFERLNGRRERKQLNRRIRAGALGLVVALAMGLAFIRSLTSGGVPADPPVEPMPAPAATGTLAYVLDGDVYVADGDGSTRSRSPTAAPPRTATAGAASTGPRDRCGRRTGGTSPIVATRTVAATRTLCRGTS